MVVAEFIAILLVAVIGGLVAYPRIASGWYDRLKKPPGQPPNWLFGGVWPALYLLMFFAIVLVTAWSCLSDLDQDTTIVALFWVQLLLNFLWIVVFFGAGLIDVGLVVIIALVAVVGLLMVRYFQAGHLTSAVFTLPYFLWIVFAMYLSIGVFVMNPCHSESQRSLPTETCF